MALVPVVAARCWRLAFCHFRGLCGLASNGTLLCICFPTHTGDDCGEEVPNLPPDDHHSGPLTEPWSALFFCGLLLACFLILLLGFCSCAIIYGWKTQKLRGCALIRSPFSIIAGLWKAVRDTIKGWFNCAGPPSPPASIGSSGSGTYFEAATAPDVAREQFAAPSSRRRSRRLLALADAKQ